MSVMVTYGYPVFDRLGQFVALFTLKVDADAWATAQNEREPDSKTKYAVGAFQQITVKEYVL